MGLVMKKCFFYLKDGSGGLEATFGLQYLDPDSAAARAKEIAQALRPACGQQPLFVVATEQGGKVLARVPVADAQSAA